MVHQKSGRSRLPDDRRSSHSTHKKKAGTAAVREPLKRDGARESNRLTVQAYRKEEEALVRNAINKKNGYSSQSVVVPRAQKYVQGRDRDSLYEVKIRLNDINERQMDFHLWVDNIPQAWDSSIRNLGTPTPTSKLSQTTLSASAITQFVKGLKTANGRDNVGFLRRYNQTIYLMTINNIENIMRQTPQALEFVDADSPDYPEVLSNVPWISDPMLEGTKQDYHLSTQKIIQLPLPIIPINYSAIPAPYDGIPYYGGGGGSNYPMMMTPSFPQGMETFLSPLPPPPPPPPQPAVVCTVDEDPENMDQLYAQLMASGIFDEDTGAASSIAVGDPAILLPDSNHDDDDDDDIFNNDLEELRKMIGEE